MSKKVTKGKKKVEMKEIENDVTKLTTFSKRRLGITKKASELATLTGAHVAVLSYSPAGKPYAFGSPSLQSVTDRFLGMETSHFKGNTGPMVGAHSQSRINSLNQEIDQLNQKLEDEKKKGKIMKKKLQGVERNGWWEVKVEHLQKPDLLELEKKFKELYIQLEHSKFCNKKSGI
ncbi:hypothetical protein Tsubulata_013934 [Turnera subulata]|uniref:MADS-box domain-containing protein n=1 Tax=Turnera subulata TaxID=218843 RepID=A0A9Q0FWG0_9ROSI|nr:hypothetical protein Tsubulata_013934 [Turnera subulata]